MSVCNTDSDLLVVWSRILIANLVLAKINHLNTANHQTDNSSPVLTSKGCAPCVGVVIPSLGVTPSGSTGCKYNWLL